MRRVLVQGTSPTQLIVQAVQCVILTLIAYPRQYLRQQGKYNIEHSKTKGYQAYNLPCIIHCLCGSSHQLGRPGGRPRVKFIRTALPTRSQTLLKSALEIFVIFRLSNNFLLSLGPPVFLLS